MDTMIKGMAIGFAGMGVEIDKFEEAPDKLTLYISVPKDADDSVKRNANGVVMAGSHLAKRIKEILSSMSSKPLTVKYKVRDEVWSEVKRKAAEAKMKSEM